MAASFEYTSDEIVAIIDNDEGGYDAKMAAFEEASDAGGDSFAVRELRDSLSDIATRAAEAAGLDYTESDIRDAVKEMVAEWRDVSGNKRAAAEPRTPGFRWVKSDRPTGSWFIDKGSVGARVRPISDGYEWSIWVGPPGARVIHNSGEVATLATAKKAALKHLRSRGAAEGGAKTKIVFYGRKATRRWIGPFSESEAKRIATALRKEGKHNVKISDAYN